MVLLPEVEKGATEQMSSQTEAKTQEGRLDQEVRESREVRAW